MIHESFNQFICNLYIKSFGEGLHRNFAMPNPFVLNNKICLKQVVSYCIITFQCLEIVDLTNFSHVAGMYTLPVRAV